MTAWSPMDKLVKWHRNEFRRRSNAVRAGTAKIDWLDPGTRVSWSEIMTKAAELDIATNDPVTLRLDFENARRGRIGPLRNIFDRGSLN